VDEVFVVDELLFSEVMLNPSSRKSLP